MEILVPSFMDFVKQFGLPVALVIFFVWNSWVRENRLAKRITDLELFINEHMLKIIENATTAIVNSTTANEKVAQGLQRLVEQLSQRPCWLDKTKYEQEQ